MPKLVSAPGETLAEILQERGQSAAEFSKSAGIAPHIILEVLQGQRQITNRLAERLGLETGLPKDFWLNRQKQYNECV